MTEHGVQSASAQLLAAQIQGDIQDIEGWKEREEREHTEAEERRPILTHLNADTSWLLSLPVPRGQEELAGSRKGRKYLHIVFDPWFTGTQEDVHGWFSTQWHKEESRYHSLEEVEGLIEEIEGLPRNGDPRKPDAKGLGEDVKTGDMEGTRESRDGCMESLIDAIVISHEFTDHMHEATLRSAVPSLPIFAPKGKAIDLLHTWSHFDTIIPIELTPSPEESPDWRNWCPDQKNVRGLEWTAWCKVTRLLAPEKSAIGYHEGVLFTYTSDLESGKAEAIIYTPHGLPPSAVQPLVGNKSITTLALLHGEHDVRLAGAQLNLGEKNGREVVQVTGARYWCATHDEVKHGSGLVSWFLSRTVGQGKEIVEGEKEKELGGSVVSCRTVDNGERLVLV